MSDTRTAENLGAEDWAGEMGERWLHNLDRFESMIAPVGDALLQRAAFKSGEVVLDVGCGGGASARAIAARVGPGGRVMGVDISAHLIAECERRAHAAGIPNAHFVVADAAAVKLPPASYDRLHSRFGSMFFPEPAAAFHNLARLVRAGGRADFAVWAPAKDNPWVGAVWEYCASTSSCPGPNRTRQARSRSMIRTISPRCFGPRDSRTWSSRCGRAASPSGAPAPRPRPRATSCCTR